MSPHIYQYGYHQKKKKKITSVARMPKRGNPSALLLGWKLLQLLWKTFWRFLSKHWKYNFHIIQQFHSWVFIQRKKTLQNCICTQMFIVALFTISKIQNQAKCSFRDEWIEKIPIFHLTIYLHTHTHTHTCTHTHYNGTLIKY